MTPGKAAAIALACLCSVPAAQENDPDRRATALVERAFDHAYNLDYAEAVAAFREALALRPDRTDIHRGLASITWLHIIFGRGSITVDQYLGGLSRGDVDADPAPPEDAATFHEHSAKALALAEKRVAARPNDPEALYALGAAVGLTASYRATVDGKVLGAFRSARRAFDAHERVLQLDPSRKDAGLIVGTYRYVVSTLSLPVRVMAYVAGFGGDRDKGLRMIEEAAAHPGASRVDAQFALLLLYNREGRFADALRVLGDLQRRYPRNRILWLEAGATALRAKQYADAERTLSAGIERLASDRRPRAFGEEAMWHYKRGAARVALRRLSEAAADLGRAEALPAREWVKGRIQIEIGKLADLAGDRARAAAAYRRAIDLAKAGRDPMARREAEALARHGFR